MDQMRNIKISKSEVQEAGRFGYRSLQATAPEKVFRERVGIRMPGMEGCLG